MAAEAHPGAGGRGGARHAAPVAAAPGPAGNPFALADLGLLLQQTGRRAAEELLRQAADAGSLDALTPASLAWSHVSQTPPLGR